jgi:ABC-2 type transport system ATP-binding protein
MISERQASLGEVGQVVVRATDLRKTFRPGRRVVEAVRGVSLTVARGEVLAFLGPNGSGKSTTIRMMAGLMRPDSGTVEVLGVDLSSGLRGSAGVGAVLEGNRNMYWRMTVGENLMYFGRLRGLSRREVRAESDRLLEQFGLAERRDDLAQQLSRGLQQRLAVALALLHRPSFLLLDEPTLGLDFESTEALKRIIHEVAGAGTAVLLATHQLDVAESLATRVSLIHRGRLVVDEKIQSLVARFSGDSFSLEVADELSPEQHGRLADLGALIHDNTITFRAEPATFWAVMDAVRPARVVRLEKSRADLMEIVLRLIGEHNATTDHK